MKKIIAVVVSVLIAQICFAQYFTLTKDGFVSKDNNDYLVIDAPGIKQADLYKNVLNALTTMYKSPSEVLSTVEGESITVTGYEKDNIIYKGKATSLTIGKKAYKFDMSYSLAILFKDGKMRFNRPSFECKHWYDGYTNTGWSSGWTKLHMVKSKDVAAGIFDENGKVVSQEAFDGITKYLNDLIAEILKKSKTVNDW